MPKPKTKVVKAWAITNEDVVGGYIYDADYWFSLSSKVEFTDAMAVFEDRLLAQKWLRRRGYTGRATIVPIEIRIKKPRK